MTPRLTVRLGNATIQSSQIIEGIQFDFNELVGELNRRQLPQLPTANARPVNWPR